LGKSSLAEFTAVRLFSSVTSHVTLKAGGLEEAFATLVAEVGAFIVVLFPVKDRRIPVCELSSTVFTFVNLPHPMALTLVKIISMQIF
jgi:hypothetical protein